MRRTGVYCMNPQGATPPCGVVCQTLRARQPIQLPTGPSPCKVYTPPRLPASSTPAPATPLPTSNTLYTVGALSPMLPSPPTPPPSRAHQPLFFRCRRNSTASSPHRRSTACTATAAGEGRHPRGTTQRTARLPATRMSRPSLPPIPSHPIRMPCTFRRRLHCQECPSRNTWRRRARHRHRHLLFKRVRTRIYICMHTRARRARLHINAMHPHTRHYRHQLPHAMRRPAPHWATPQACCCSGAARQPPAAAAAASGRPRGRGQPLQSRRPQQRSQAVLLRADRGGE